jgi:DNA-binding transcriptional ArsR family regulator
LPDRKSLSSGIAIRFHLAADEHAALAFGYSPLLETVLSLHVLAEPKHHALQHDWVRAMRSLPQPLRRELRALEFLYRWTLPNCVLPSATTEFEDFETEVGRLRALPVDVAAFELVRTVYDHGGRGRRKEVLADPGVRTDALRHAGKPGSATRRAATQLLEDPAAFVERFATFLEAYWEAAFADEWGRIEPRLAEGVVAAGRAIASDGAFPFLVGLAPQLRVDLGARTFGLDLPHEHDVQLTGQSPLLLMPSVYVWPHVRVNCDPPWPLTLSYRAPHLADSLRHTSPPELVRVFRALGDVTRMRILEQLARRPRSTQELAPLVGLSEAGTSKHLRLLADAGVVTSRREGYYVVYSVVDERLESLTGDLRHALARTTRKSGPSWSSSPPSSSASSDSAVKSTL